MRNDCRVAVALGVVFLWALEAAAADATGKWRAEFESPVGLQKYTYELKVDGAKVTGKASFERMDEKGEVELKDGKITGDDISFTEMLDFQGNQLAITYTGKVGADEIKFTRKVGDFGSEDLVAKRVKE